MNDRNTSTACYKSIKAARAGASGSPFDRVRQATLISSNDFRWLLLSYFHPPLSLMAFPFMRLYLLWALLYILGRKCQGFFPFLVAAWEHVLLFKCQKSQHGSLAQFIVRREISQPAVKCGNAFERKLFPGSEIKRSHLMRRNYSKAGG